MKSIMFLKNQTIGYLRKYLGECIKLGKVVVLNQSHITSISKFIAYLRKPECLEILEAKELNIMHYKRALCKVKGITYSAESSDNSDSSNSNSDSSNNNNDEGNSEGSSDANSEANFEDCESCDGTGVEGNDTGHDNCGICHGTGTKSGTNSDANSENESDEQLPNYNLVTDIAGLKSLPEFKSDLNLPDISMIKDQYENSQEDLREKCEEAIDNANEVVDVCKEAVDTALSSIGFTHKVEISVNSKVVTNSKEHYHPQFAEVLYYAKRDKNVMLVGESGAGKSHMGEQLARALKLKFCSLSCSEGMSESHILGRPKISLKTDNDYIVSDFINKWEYGGLILIDEYDCLDANMTCVLNTGLAQGYVSVPYRSKKPMAYRHKDTIVIFAGNTWGNGQGSVKYSGRNRIDKATLDRFTKIELKYDPSLEIKMCRFSSARLFLDSLRFQLKENNLEHIISTRQYIKSNRWFADEVKFGKLSCLGQLAKRVTADWTDREKAKCGVDELVAKYDKQANREIKKFVTSNSKG